jgi:hypothetical protein
MRLLLPGRRASMQTSPSPSWSFSRSRCMNSPAAKTYNLPGESNFHQEFRVNVSNWETKRRHDKSDGSGTEVIARRNRRPQRPGLPCVARFFSSSRRPLRGVEEFSVAD